MIIMSIGKFFLAPGILNIEYKDVSFVRHMKDAVEYRGMDYWIIIGEDIH